MMKVVEGNVLSILLDHGTVLLQDGSDLLGMKFEVFDFCEFEDLGMEPEESWEGRLCRAVMDKGKLVGARIK